MWSFLCPHRATLNRDDTVDTSGETMSQDSGIFTGYESDWSEDDLDDMDNEEEPENINNRGPQTEDLANGGTPHPGENPILIPPISTFGAAERKRRRIAAETSVPPLKRQKHETPIRVLTHDERGWCGLTPDHSSNGELPIPSQRPILRKGPPLRSDQGRLGVGISGRLPQG